MSTKSDAVENRELWVLTPGEAARVLLHEGRAAAKVARGKAAGRASSAADAVWDGAARRVAIEDAAVAQARQSKQDAKYQARAERAARRVR